MAAIRDAIFDLDGTLIDSLPGIGWSIQAALSALTMRRRSIASNGPSAPATIPMDGGRPSSSQAPAACWRSCAPVA
jgi:phosphoglycolate phosphatase-like HAD superfamily hydrolase